MPLWPRRGKWERQLDAEVRFHLESRIEDLMRGGLSRHEAEARARREFGPVELTKDECRDHKPGETLALLFRDLRHACRFLVRSPGFTATAIATMALGVGANAAIVGVVYATLIRPLPYASPGDLYAVDVAMEDQATQFPTLPVTVQLYQQWRQARTEFSAMATLTPWECSLTGDGEPERLGGAQVSTNFFDVLGVPVQIGRAFHFEEEQPGRERVVVISDGLWKRRYGADPAVVGRTISINGQPHLVVGVASPSLLVPTGTQLNPALSFAARVDLWRPLAPTPRDLKSESWDQGLLVRLRPGGTPESRSAAASVHARRHGGVCCTGASGHDPHACISAARRVCRPRPRAAAARLRRVAVAARRRVRQPRQSDARAARGTRRRTRDARRPWRQPYAAAHTRHRGNHRRDAHGRRSRRVRGALRCPAAHDIRAR